MLEYEMISNPHEITKSNKLGWVLGCHIALRTVLTSPSLLMAALQIDDYKYFYR